MRVLTEIAKGRYLLVTTFMFLFALTVAMETNHWVLLTIPALYFICSRPKLSSSYIGIIVVNSSIIAFERGLTVIELYGEILISSSIITLVSIMIIKKEKQLMTDPLTKVYNRNYYNDIMKSGRNMKDLSMVLIDIDFFKNVNDTYGHDAGDYVLREVSNVLVRSTRKNDSVIRMGGEEFLVLSTKSTKEEGLYLSERLRRIVEETEFIYEKEKINITISAGFINNKNKEADKISTLFNLADEALYRAKRGGRNKIEVAA